MSVVFVAIVGVIVVLGMPMHVALPALVGVGVVTAWLAMTPRTAPGGDEMQLALLRTKTVLGELEAARASDHVRH